MFHSNRTLDSNVFRNLASLSNDIDSWFCDGDNIYDELQVIYLRCDWDSCKRYLWPGEIWVVSSNALWGENDQWGFDSE